MDRPPIGDVWIPRLVVVFLGLVALASGIGATVLAINRDEIPPFIAGLGTAAISTLGMLAAVLNQRPTAYGESGTGSRIFPDVPGDVPVASRPSDGRVRQ